LTDPLARREQQMDRVYSAQYLTMKDSFSRQGVNIEVALTPAGDAQHVYAAGRLLAVDRDDNIQRLQDALPGLRRADSDEQPQAGDLVLLSTDEVEGGHLTVPDALDAIDDHLGDDNPALAGEEPLVGPVHIVHITKLCPAGEPEVPSGHPAQPWPAPRPAGQGGNGVRLAVSDTGLLPDLDLARYPWLAGVTGERDELGPVLPGGQPSIPEYTGHGTFVAGVARCMAPGASVYVNNHFAMSGGELEHVIIAKLEQLIREQSPDVICLPAGTYTRNNWAPLAFSDFRRRHPDITLVAAAGNDSTDRPFWPAAFPWVIGVGALGADQQHRAWFSNHGDWVNVYALGEGLVNAYASGVYTYREPPKRPAKQTFDGMARWDGTSFATPLVAGLIADEISRNGSSAPEAAQAVLARAQQISGVGLALIPSYE
jgi:subtilisin family serine protease